MAAISPEQAFKELKYHFKAHEYDVFTDDQVRLMAEYWSYLMDVNPKLNMTRIHRLEDAAVKHFIDCCIVTKFIELPDPLLDMGSGPGFPGIPLKIISPQTRIILAEGVQNRVNFLKEVRDKLKLDKLDIIGRNVDSKFLYPVEGVITRAVEAIPDTLKNVQNCLKPGGRVILMKGPEVEDEVKKAKSELKDLYSLEKDVSYTLPKTAHQRRLIVFKKNK